jgi:hypothetical protein
MTAKASAIQRLREERRLATLVAFATTLEAAAQDDALDLLDILITEIFSDATKAGEKARLRTNLVSNQFTGLNAIVIPGTLRDSLYLLAVVLEQQTELNPTEIMTDTGAYTDVVFGLFWLLGFRFSPRIADIGGARYWRIGPSADTVR